MRRTESKKSHVVIAGNLVALPQRAFASEIRGLGYEVQSTVDSQTDLLILGGETWPFDKSGRLNREVTAAMLSQSRGSSIRILGECDFLRDLSEQGMLPSGYSSAELIHACGMPTRTFRSIRRQNLLVPKDNYGALEFFGFLDIRLAKHLWQLRRRGVSNRQLQRALIQLERVVPDARAALVGLETGSLWRGRDRRGRSIDLYGNLLFDDDWEEPVNSTAFRLVTSHFEAGWEAEQVGDLERAVFEYEASLMDEDGVDAIVSFNLGNVLFRQHRFDAAAQRYHQSLRYDGDSADTWSNYGCALARCSGREQESIEAFRAALTIDPCSLHALRNLALELERTEDKSSAVEIWHKYRLLDASKRFTAESWVCPADVFDCGVSESTVAPNEMDVRAI